MSGHNKWSQIKRRKGASDAARSRLFSRYSRLITIEAKKAGGVLSAPGLSAAINRAKTENMPKDSIERAILKGSSNDSDTLEEVIYEAYGPGGVALIIDALTDNKNRTTPEIKHLLSKQGIEVSPPGAAVWAFTKIDGVFSPNKPLIPLSLDDEEKLTETLEALDEHEDVQRVFTNAEGYENSGD